MPQALGIYVKRFVTELFADPENFLSTFFKFIVAPILILLLLFLLPLSVVASIPSLLLSKLDVTGTNNANQEILLKQSQYIAIYQNAPKNIDKANQDWINSIKNQYPGYEVNLNYNFNLTWQILMAIDAVRYDQDFDNVNKTEVIKLGNMFLSKNVTTSTRLEDELDDTSNTKTSDNLNADQLNDLFESYYNDTAANKTQQTKRTKAIHVLTISVTTKDIDIVLNDLGFTDDQIKAVHNIYDTIINADTEGNLNIYDEDLTNLQQYPPGTAYIPYYNQADQRWGAESYGSSTIKSGGCGPTSLAMVVAGLTKRADITPKVIADWSVANGFRAEGEGSYWGLMPNGGKYFGLNVTAISRTDPNSILKALSQGHPVIAAMGRGHFTNGGHFIVLFGISKDGKILVNDPASIKRTNVTWDLSTIINESSTNGGINGSPFWTFSN